MRALLQYELLCRIVMKPFYQCLLRFIELYRNWATTSNEVQAEHLLAVVDTLLTPQWMVSAFYTKWSYEITGAIAEEAPHWQLKKCQVGFGRARPYLKNRTFCSSKQLQPEHKDQDKKDEIIGWRLGIDLDLSRCAALGLPFLEKLRTTEDVAVRRQTLLDALAVLNLDSENDGIRCLAKTFQEFWLKGFWVPAALNLRSSGAEPGFCIPRVFRVNADYERHAAKNLSQEGCQYLCRNFGVPLFGYGGRQRRGRPSLGGVALTRKVLGEQ
ncbi:hypothetical protein OQA88_10699 [Cercophora sp. LCS_1]